MAGGRPAGDQGASSGPWDGQPVTDHVHTVEPGPPRFLSRAIRGRSVCPPADTSRPMSNHSRERGSGQRRPHPHPPRPMSKPPRDPVEPERLLLDHIAAGALDPHLVAIADAVRARHELLHTITSHKALAMLNVGDRVQINHHASPRYLHGIYGVVVELDQHAAVVRVHRPIGRFKSGEIRCPPLALDRLRPRGCSTSWRRTADPNGRTSSNGGPVPSRSPS